MNKKEMIERINKSGLQENKKRDAKLIISNLPDKEFTISIYPPDIDINNDYLCIFSVFNDWHFVEKSMSIHKIIDRLKDLELEQ